MNDEDIAKDGRRRWTLKKVQDLAASRGGKLISNIYKNTNDDLMWECGTCFHCWPANLNHIKRGSWCPNCNKPECTIEQAYEIAKSKNGKCLTIKEDFKNGGQKLLWECQCNYTWMASLYKVKNKGTWCPRCGKTEKLTYEQVKNEIELRGWKLLSEKYENQGSKLKIKCKNDHIFSESIGKIKHRGYGCKYCNTTYIAENICRIHFETIFDAKFPTLRPKYMEGLEFDGYCSELGIAFEHHGEQHYNLKALRGIHWEYSENDFKSLQQRDNRKIELAKKFGIKLIIIPSLFSRTKLTDLKHLIKTECEKNNVNIKCDINNTYIPIEIPYNKKIVSYEELYKLYIIENKRYKEICKLYNITKGQFCTLIKAFNINKRVLNE